MEPDSDLLDASPEQDTNYLQFTTDEDGNVAILEHHVRTRHAIMPIPLSGSVDDKVAAILDLAEQRQGRIMFGGSEDDGAQDVTAEWIAIHQRVTNELLRRSIERRDREEG